VGLKDVCVPDFDVAAPADEDEAPADAGPLPKTLGDDDTTLSVGLCVDSEEIEVSEESLSFEVVGSYTVSAGCVEAFKLVNELFILLLTVEAEVPLLAG